LGGQGPVETFLLRRVRESPICAALIDPEEFTPELAAKAAKAAIEAKVGMILIGGSTLSDRGRLDDVV